MNNRKAKYICFEGTEGCGKTTHTRKLVEHLRARGYKVFQTKEPGTPHSPITMELRAFMLDAKYDSQLTTTSRELISQAIRAIHVEKVVVPALSEYDYIIQDRGLLSGLAYGHACGNSHWFLTTMAGQVTQPAGTNIFGLYDQVIYLKNDSTTGLALAQATKQEYVAGDAMELRGADFMSNVAKNMDEMVQAFPHCIINVEGKTVEENFFEILRNIP